jgi:hypothetical protein
MSNDEIEKRKFNYKKRFKRKKIAIKKIRFKFEKKKRMNNFGLKD